MIFGVKHDQHTEKETPDDPVPVGPARALEAIRAGGDIDTIRRGAELVYRALIEAEATERIGAGRFERTDARTTQRNGHRTRTLSTKAGDLELKIPKLRKGSFFPSLLERSRRIDRALCRRLRPRSAVNCLECSIISIPSAGTIEGLPFVRALGVLFERSQAGDDFESEARGLPGNPLGINCTVLTGQTCTQRTLETSDQA